MPRDLPIGNGDMLVTFDGSYQARDIYYPFVGKYNHAVGQPQKFGVWASSGGGDGKFAWIDDPAWKRTLAYRPGTLVTDVTLEHEGLGLILKCADCVDFHETVWLRKVIVRDTSGKDRDVRLFYHFDLSIQETPVGDTANYDPASAGLVLYKGDHYFLFNGVTNKSSGIDHWAIGTKRLGGAEGTWRDAEDGLLGMNAISQGSVDATAGFNLKLTPMGEGFVSTWLAAAHDYETLFKLSTMIRERTPDKFINRTDAYWKLWASKEKTDLSSLPKEVQSLYTRSLLTLRTQIDNRGAIIAANDSDITHFAGDTYSYCWPRDGALVAAALVRAGQSELSREFFRFCAKCITKNGYFMHKYTPDGKLASSWHPWVIQGQEVLPVQQDETALVIWALRKHFEAFRDVEFIKPLYNALVVTPAKWMTDYRDASGLPLPSWDLWEERRGIHTFTVAATIAGLRAAGAFATDFGDTGRAAWFNKAASEMTSAMKAHLWNPATNSFARMATPDGKGHYQLDMTRDAANFAVWALGAIAVNDPMAVGDMLSTRDKLWCKTDIGGIARYENDYYHQIARNDPNIPGNPWIICTLWHAQWAIARATNPGELESAANLLSWVAQRACASGVLAEQVNPTTGAPISVSPLTWSHATVILAVHDYLDKRAALEATAEAPISMA